MDNFSDLVAENLIYFKKIIARFRRSPEWNEDVLQESLLKAFVNFNSCKDKQKFRRWARQIIRNTACTVIRDTREDATGMDFNKLSSADVQQDQSIYDDYVSKYTMIMINKLPDKQKEVFIERYLNGESFSSIAAKMKCPYNTAKANYRHAMVKIKASYDRGDL